MQRFSGSVPAPEAQAEGCEATGEAWEKRLMRRVAQIGAGVVFGSRGFVTAQIGGFAACFHGESVRVRPVFGAACASHGHRLAAQTEV